MVISYPKSDSSWWTRCVADVIYSFDLIPCKIHVLNEPRGSTLEVIISRMKAQANNIRFIMVSATVPNIRDIADWIGNPSVNFDAPATVFEVQFDAAQSLILC